MDAEKTGQKAKDALKGKKENKPAVIPKTLTHSSSEQIGNLLRMYASQISQSVPRHVTAERIIQLCTTVIARNPKVKNCELTSIIGAVMQASILGLDMTPQFGQCFFIPRKNKKTGKMDCTFLIGYKGYIQLMRRSGEVSTVYAYVVRENDYWDYELGSKPNLIHRPALSDRGEKLCAYAVVQFKDGGQIFEVMSKEDIMRAKGKSQAKGSEYSPWNTEDEESMWRKTSIRKLQNYAPMSTEFIHATATDGVVIRPEMFNQQTRQLDPTKLEPEDYEVVSDPGPGKAKEIEDQKQKKQTKKDKPPAEKQEPDKEPESDFLKAAKKVKKEIIRLDSEERYLKEIGLCGYESINEVPDSTSHQTVVLQSLYRVAKELAKDKNTELDL